MPGRSARQHDTVTTMIDIAQRMAIQTQLITRRDVVEVGDVSERDHRFGRLESQRALARVVVPLAGAKDAQWR